ncbi:hypothetical protein CEP52_003018 [Fusarium oligoseptatum]|uniref:Uncharacterized protein n=1 Tax=Fusarium oligoseptatum TaxID=2604345 RepID=A0A428UAS3_9HYPO|nr:hypothetical protein CEP52_003018 [Fusarium oligoseptatum]
MESNDAIGNQSNDYSIQHNGPVRQHVSVYVGSSGVTPVRNLPSALPSVSDEFCLGPIPVLDDDPDSYDESQPKQRPSPILDKDDVKYITEMGIEIRQKYELVLSQTACTGVNGVEQLRLKSRKIEGRIKGSKSSKISKGSKVSKRSKSHRSSGAFKILEVFENLKELFGQTERDVAAIASHVYQLSGCPLLSESTKGFDTLLVSSSATRALYRHLCQACPVGDQHNHTALISLVPEKEPRRIVLDNIAITAHHVAIKSTSSKGDYVWFEAQSKLLLPVRGNEAVYSEPSSPEAMIEGLRQWLRRDSGISTASASLSREQVQLSLRGPESRDLYRIKVCPGSLAQGGDGLAMCIGSDQGGGCHEMRYLDEERRPKTGCKPLKLSDIIQQGNVRRDYGRADLLKRSHKLRDDRFKIAFKIAEAALRYGWRDWLGDAWGIQNIEFYPYEYASMPFLRAENFKHGCGKLEKFMFNLGFVLLQLGLWEWVDICTSEAIFNKDLENQLIRLGLETRPGFQEAVRYCCEFSRYGDCQGDDDDFQQAFYQKVISPLREMVKTVELQR